MPKKLQVEIPQLKLTFKVNNLKLTEKQKLFLALALQEETNIMFVSGPAGSTKTYMAVYAALRHLSANDDLDMFYVRTIIESGDKGLGALPGSVEEKINPYMAPLQDKLIEMLPPEKSARSELMESGRIQAMPINYLRGASWKDKIVVADEAQNFTFKELTTLITRLGKNSKLFICGDFMQSDIGSRTGYNDMFKLFNDPESEEKGIHCFGFTKEDILRSELQKYIIGRLEQTFKKKV
jgi:phosphate starvation-inducible PhoH-like protein|tara:strand:+ start:1155 stop:1868 length:714 start_codon:yes stop_codon:yes gene_type:complete